jgi:hypothetical protein
VLRPVLINNQTMCGYRNRPPELHNAPSEPASGRERQRSDRIAAMSKEHGLDPAEKAGLVDDAIRAEQFWILTHD